VGSNAGDFVTSQIQTLAKLTVKGILGSFDSVADEGPCLGFRTLRGIQSTRFILSAKWRWSVLNVLWRGTGDRFVDVHLFTARSARQVCTGA
jgi:hypothetical protein